MIFTYDDFVKLTKDNEIPDDLMNQFDGISDDDLKEMYKYSVKVLKEKGNSSAFKITQDNAEIFTQYVNDFIVHYVAEYRNKTGSKTATPNVNEMVGTFEVLVIRSVMKKRGLLS